MCNQKKLVPKSRTDRIETKIDTGITTVEESRAGFYRPRTKINLGLVTGEGLKKIQQKDGVLLDVPSTEESIRQILSGAQAELRGMGLPDVPTPPDGMAYWRDTAGIWRVRPWTDEPVEGAWKRYKSVESYLTTECGLRYFDEPIINIRIIENALKILVEIQHEEICTDTIIKIAMKLGADNLLLAHFNNIGLENSDRNQGRKRKIWLEKLAKYCFDRSLDRNPNPTAKECWEMIASEENYRGVSRINFDHENWKFRREITLNGERLFAVEVDEFDDEGEEIKISSSEATFGTWENKISTIRKAYRQQGH